MEEKKTEQAGQCCTVKVSVEQGGETCCPEAEGERVIKLMCDPAELKGKTVKVICCPEPNKGTD